MARASKPAINLREKLADLANQPAPRRVTFWTSGDTTTTDFPLETGWKPADVFVNGAIMRPGSGEDYTVSFDGVTYTVVFAVAPAAVDIAIQAEG